MNFITQFLFQILKKEYKILFRRGLIFSRGDLSWEGGVALPQNSYKPSHGLREATLYEELYRSTVLARICTKISEAYRSLVSKVSAETLGNI